MLDAEAGGLGNTISPEEVDEFVCKWLCLVVPGLLCPSLFFHATSMCAFFAGVGKSKSSVEDGLCLCGHRPSVT